MDIKEIFRGALSFSEDQDGFIMPCRFTEKQMARYKKLPNGAYADAPAGVVADFYTDSEEISFGYAIYRSWTSMYKDSAPTVDVFENGVLTGSYALSYSDEGNVHGFRHRSELSGERRVTLVFPANAVMAIGDISLGNWRRAEREKERLLVLGDSVSQGFMNNSASNNYPFLLCRLLSAELLNQSVGGEVFSAEALDATGFEPDRIIVSLGTNDMVFVNNFEKSAANIENYFARLRELYPESEVTVITPTWTDPEAVQQGSRELLDRIAAYTEKTAKGYGYRVLDGKKLVPHGKRYYSDGVHPNDLGFAHYALNLAKEFLCKKCKNGE